MLYQRQNFLFLIEHLKGLVREMKKDLLLIVDMQNVYLPGNEWECPSINGTINKIKYLLDRGVEAVFTRFIKPQPIGTWENYNKTYEKINNSVHLNDIVAELKLYTNKFPVYNKSTYSSWTEDVKIMSEKYDRIILCGVVADCCILSTLFSIIDSGKEVIYLTDCISGKNSDNEKMIQKLVENFSPVHVNIMDSKSYYKKYKSMGILS